MTACRSDPSGRQILVPRLLTDAHTVLEPFRGRGRALRMSSPLEGQYQAVVGDLDAGRVQRRAFR